MGGAVPPRRAARASASGPWTARRVSWAAPWPGAGPTSGPHWSCRTANLGSLVCCWWGHSQRPADTVAAPRPGRRGSRPIPGACGAGCCVVSPRAELWVGGSPGGSTAVHRGDPRGLPWAARNADPGPNSGAPTAGSALRPLPPCRPLGERFMCGGACPLTSGLQEADQTPLAGSSVAGLEPLSPPPACSLRSPGLASARPHHALPAFSLLLRCL